MSLSVQRHLCGSVAYCLRKNGAACVLASGCNPVAFYLGAIETPGTVRHAETYGIARSDRRNEFWLSDKRNHRLLLVRVQAPLEKNKFTILREVRDALVKSPCSLDYSNAHGVLTAHYGLYTSMADSGVSCFDRDQFVRLSPVGIGRVTHCCWLEGTQFCFVTRNDSILWIQAIGGKPTQLTRSGVTAPQMSGRISELCLQYVQGLYYSKAKGVLLVADAVLGTIFQLALKSGTFSVMCGVPAISNSSWKSDVSSSDHHRWLGRIRAVSEDLDGNIIWIDGETGQILKLERDTIYALGKTDPDLRNVTTSGCGLIVF